MNYNNVLDKFITQMNYMHDDNVEGIIFYGSYQTNTNTKYSDIDIMILFSDEAKIKQIKGSMLIDDIEVEYFEKSLSYVYKRAEDDFKNGEDSLLSIIGYGKVLLDRNDKIKELRKYILEKYSNPLPTLSENDSIYCIYSIQKAVDSLIQLYNEEDLYFEAFYYLTLEKIRVFYHRLNGYSNISSSKIYKMYTTENIQKAQHKRIPEKPFIEIYLDAILAKDNNERIKKVKKLYQYSISGFDIDFNNIRIDLNERKY